MTIEPTQKMTTRERIAQDRRALSEILVNAILFGLALNLIADFLFGLPDTGTNPWSWSLLIFGGGLTLGSYYFLVRQYLGEEARVEESITAALFIDTKSGELVQLDHPYIPQVLAREHIKRLSRNDKNTLTENLKGLSPSVKVDAAVLLFETVLRYFLHDEQYFETYQPPHYASLYAMGLDLETLTRQIPGTIEIKTETSDNELVLKLKLERGSAKIVSSMQIKNTTYNPEFDRSKPVQFMQILPYFKFSDSFSQHFNDEPERPPSDIILVEFNADLLFRFHPVILHVRGEKTSDIIEKIKEIVGFMKYSFDWFVQRNAVAMGQRALTIGRRTDFDIQ